MKWTQAWIMPWVMLLCASISMGASAADPGGEIQQPAEGAKAGLSYKGVNLQLGGFLASETVYRNNNTASDIGTAFSNLPFANSAGSGMAEFRGTERQSRFSLLAQGDADSDTHLAGYYELDFLGTSPTANAAESNSYTPRTRHVYMTMDWEDAGFHLLAGQTWSLVTLNGKGITPRNEVLPPTIDAQYAVGFDWARQWQIRVVKDWNKRFWAALSLENAQTAGVSGTAPGGTSNTNSLAKGASLSNPMSFNGYPDAIVKLAWESDFGHYEVYNLLRDFQSRFGPTAATQTHKQNSWTDAIGGGITVPILPKVLDVSLSGLFGKGIGRYGTSGLSDAAFAADGSLTPLSGSQYLAQISWHATSAWEVYLAYGEEQLSATSVGTGYGYGNGAVASNAGCSTLGAACAPNLKSVSQGNIGFWWSFYKGDFGATKLGVQYSHTTVNTYADNAGFAPSTSEDMVFTSLRYYPF